ncbi:uncharacterized protein si:dkey-56d12.4 [Mugil cephalus]|uniref:uncharacterized protein si:dkey-56d12.4 n=1 Tax=Mugil cephalus TaxID=48193 RepID=UPI001FB61C92|nr:uncharacterized protein si:dkey-56d12.4 [Mugil cephalus]
MTSGSTCSVADCHNNSKKLKNLSETVCLKHQKLRRECPCPAPYALHSMPRKEQRKLAWLAALKLKHPPKRVYVCSYHFVDKHPTELHPDPELYLGYYRPPPPAKRPMLVPPKFTQTDENVENGPHCTSGLTSPASDQIGPASQVLHSPPDLQKCSVQTQWEDLALQDHDYCETDYSHDVQDEIGYFTLQNDADALLYIGIALKTFNTLVSTLEGHANNSLPLPVKDQVLMTLMKLKTNQVVGHLSRRFHTSQSMASKIISYWIDKLDEVLRPLIPWLPRETIRATMPAVFKGNFPNVTCLLDFSESLLQKPENLNSRRESHSHYYSHNTVKYLVAVAPCGLIMFVSAAYGGRCSNKFITRDSRILDYLVPGDEVVADGGFTIKDLLLERKVKLVLPSFTKELGQLPEEQVTNTGPTANVVFHVRRAVGRLKDYKILSQVVPITMTPKIDKILRICAAMVNLGGSHS